MARHVRRRPPYRYVLVRTWREAVFTLHRSRSNSGAPTWRQVSQMTGTQFRGVIGAVGFGGGGLIGLVAFPGPWHWATQLCGALGGCAIGYFTRRSIRKNPG